MLYILLPVISPLYLAALTPEGEDEGPAESDTEAELVVAEAELREAVLGTRN